MGVQALLLSKVALGDGAEHLLGRLGGGQVIHILGILALHEADPAGAAGSEHGPCVISLVGETLNELTALFHDGQVSGEIGVEDVVEAQTAQRGNHAAGGSLFLGQAQMLGPGGTDGRSHLHDGGQLRILHAGVDTLQIVTGAQRTHGTMGDTLAAEGAVRLPQGSVERNAHGGAAAGAHHVPDMHALDLVTDLDAAHALDALALVADQVVGDIPGLVGDVLGIGIIDQVIVPGQLLEGAVAVTDAQRAVGIVLGQNEAQIDAAGALDPVGGSMDHHTIPHSGGTGGNQSFQTFHFHHADPAGGDLIDLLQIAEGGDLDADGLGSIEDRGLSVNCDLQAVDRQSYHFSFRPPLKLP